MEKSRYTVEKLVNNPSFKRWVEGKARKDDAEFWDRWIAEDEKNLRVAREAEAELLGISFHDTGLPSVEPQWQRTKARLLEQSENSSFPRSVNIPKHSSFRWMYRVAAMLLIGLFTGAIAFMIYQTSSSSSQPEVATRTVSTDFGERNTVHFSDGSKAILNAHSTLSYQPNSEQRGKVLVELDGEAFFSVAKRVTSDEGAFSVQTEDGEISVLGTRFSVSTRDGRTQVVLEEGLVRMTPMEDLETGNEEKENYLRPGELARFDRNSDSIFIKKVNPQVYISWATPILVFDQTPLKEVAERIEHTFGVEVIITDPQLSDQKISGSVENSGLEVILSALSSTMMIPAKVKNEKVYLGGLPPRQVD